MNTSHQLNTEELADKIFTILQKDKPREGHETLVYEAEFETYLVMSLQEVDKDSQEIFKERTLRKTFYHLMNTVRDATRHSQEVPKDFGAYINQILETSYVFSDAEKDPSNTDKPSITSRVRDIEQAIGRSGYCKIISDTLKDIRICIANYMTYAAEHLSNRQNSCNLENIEEKAQEIVLSAVDKTSRKSGVYEALIKAIVQEGLDLKALGNRDYKIFGDIADSCVLISEDNNLGNGLSLSDTFYDKHTKDSIGYQIDTLQKSAQ